MRHWTIECFLVAMLILSAPALGFQQLDGFEGFLAVYVSPPTLIADGRNHSCIIVQLLDAEGNPMPARRDTTVFLASSNIEVGDVEDTIVIPKGRDHAVAVFRASEKPGETLITASAAGFKSASASLRTFSLAPCRLVVYAPTLVEAGGFSGKICIQTVDLEGRPVAVPSSLTVTLTSSNTSVVELPIKVTVERGEAHAFIEFKSVGVGGVVVAASADGLLSGKTILNVMDVGGAPVALTLYPLPQTLPPGGRGYIGIQLLDAKGRPAKADAPIMVHLSSSNPDVVRILDPVVVVWAGKCYAEARVEASVKPGSTVITALAMGLQPVATTVDVKGHVPSTLAVYVSPPKIVADGSSTSLIVVQTQTEEGIPVPSQRSLVVHLIPSNSLVAGPAMSVMLRAGESYAIAQLTSTLTPGSATITALGRGLKASEAEFQTVLLPLDITLEAPSSASVNQTYTVTLTALSGGLPVAGASVNWTVSGGQILSMEDETNDAGLACLTVKQIASKLIVSVLVKKPGYKPASTSKTVVAPTSPALVQEPTIDILGLKVPVGVLAAAIAVVATAMAAAYFYLRRMGRQRAFVEV
ncbi:MAG: hypothetical protein QW794_03830 [Thermosphaera sp.]